MTDLERKCHHCGLQTELACGRCFASVAMGCECRAVKVALCPFQARYNDATIVFERLNQSMDLWRMELMRGFKKNGIMMKAFNSLKAEHLTKLEEQLDQMGMFLCEHEGHSMEDHGSLCRFCCAPMYKPAEAGEGKTEDANG